MFSTKEIALANELAETLQDFHSITQYLRFTQKYTEDQLRETLDRVMDMPQEKIRRSRGALFTHLIKHYDKEQEYYRNKPRHQEDWDSTDREW